MSVTITLRKTFKPHTRADLAVLRELVVDVVHSEEEVMDVRLGGLGGFLLQGSCLGQPLLDLLLPLLVLGREQEGWVLVGVVYTPLPPLPHMASFQSKQAVNGCGT